MLDKKIILALNGADDAFLEETAQKLGYNTEMKERTVAMNTYRKRTSRRFFSVLLAATLLLSLGIAAYATELFGIRALLIKNEDMPPAITEGGAYVSITQPQDVPEEMSQDIKAKIENSTKAWAEWKDYLQSNEAFVRPEVFVEPEGTMASEYVENEDGTYTVIFYSEYIPIMDEAGNIIDWDMQELERRIASAEEYEREMNLMLLGSQGYPGYDFNYNVYSDESAKRLEEIAAAYGLNLRHESTAMFENFGEFTQFNTFDELIAKINQVCAGGQSFFRIKPTGFDKFYYFDEGTFAVSFFTTEDKTNLGTSCYLYNSPYSTLSSGFEIVGMVRDIDAMDTYIHVAPDGTELTVLHNGADMFAYVYLENSFVTLSFHQTDGLSPEEINSIIDMVNFSVIK